ncbi:hypothetical protein, partial [Klebsiella pneumoniae]|uniref:hypothetical protein n=1 Tax=Klebsiella pneumoniae TaxID=573 RepID=UPI001D0E6371
KQPSGSNLREEFPEVNMNLAKFLHLDHEKNIFMINGRLILNEIDKNQASRPLLQDDPIVGQKL